MRPGQVNDLLRSLKTMKQLIQTANMHPEIQAVLLEAIKVMQLRIKQEKAPIRVIYEAEESGDRQAIEIISNNIILEEKENV